MFKSFALILSLFVFSSCESTSGLLQGAGDVLAGDPDNKPTNSAVVSGLKEALITGITNGADAVSQTDGYFGNKAIKILFPPEAEKAENTLRNLGMGSLVDKAVLKINRAAEEAAKEAKPIFIAAIKEMTFQDAMGILLGGNNSATNYLRKTTSDERCRVPPPLPPPPVPPPLLLLLPILCSSTSI